MTMQNKWSDKQADDFKAGYAEEWGEDLALRVYTSRLLGAEKKLVLHGGGNCSVKRLHAGILGAKIPAIHVKASGRGLSVIEPSGFPGMDLEYLKKLRALPELPDEKMINEIRTHLFDCDSPFPSIETLVHAFIPARYIDHTHAGAALTLTNQPGAEELVGKALGGDILFLPYVEPGFKLAKAAADAYEAHPEKLGMVWAGHGLTTWGETARESYERMIEAVTRMEKYIESRSTRPLQAVHRTDPADAKKRWIAAAPILRGRLASPSGDADRPYRRVILKPLIERETLDFVDSDRGRELAVTPPLTSDHLIRTLACPLWIDSPAFEDIDRLKDRISDSVARFREEYRRYQERSASRLAGGVTLFDPSPRVVMIPGLGVACAGDNAVEAGIAGDIIAHTLEVKSAIGAMGRYEGLDERSLFDMEYRGLQHAKLEKGGEPPLGRQVALVTGAAGAIGAGIARVLLENGCHVAVTDLPGEHLDSLTRELAAIHRERVIGVPLDVTDADSVTRGFESVILEWGGVDLVIVNAGTAHVSSLAEMDLAAFRALERVNIEGTLLLLSEAARHFELQGTGGDVVLVSTKNVFAPGAKFGAYSATKAASHQLARIASLEMAELGVRVNMVSPDAVFSDGARKSGLWAEVGPDRMRARNLDEEGLEEYYRSRNLLKARITATHVGNAVLYFAARQSPTTGATIPVDGGLPDSTPR